MIAKGCPKCDQQVPVACKACPCGYSFFNARKTAQLQLSPGEEYRRRTGRVRREIDYYDGLDYDKKQDQMKKSRTSECDDDDNMSRKELNKAKRKKVKKEEEDDDELVMNLSPEKQLQCSLILEELNRKMQVVTWKPTE
ncbi:PREDICTED: UPF0547 protein C16orf87 homolog [Nicrophorus vespilloides]|uniref:UPF0547 protein C16orf87 homolog n=1 Tax=Nicrophorus vespilloides TaxID=110193 RepID=A0ABM1MNW0_NICVS|nr:PREDICTED: UPF0547 protein C16orf87 homolog [Nicrophorus vespilloides]